MSTTTIAYKGSVYCINTQELYDVYAVLSHSRIFISTYKNYKKFLTGIEKSISIIHDKGYDYCGFCGFVVSAYKDKDVETGYRVKVTLDAQFIKFRFKQQRSISTYEKGLN